MSVKKTLILFLMLPFMVFAASDTLAQSKHRVKFAPGSTGATVKGTVRGYAYRDYIVGASAGQQISVTIGSKTPATIFTIFLPDGDNLEGASQMEEFSGELPVSGDYVIRVGMMRSQARRKGSISTYTLKITIQ